MTRAAWLVAAACALGTGHAAAQAGGGYGRELAQVYGTYQALLARKEACDEALPGTRGAVEKGFKAWRGRNDRVVAELQDRLGAMIRGASRDEKDYARNIGKYEGAMLQQRREVKEALLAQPRDELTTLCEALPALLAGREADLEAVYGEELKNIRSRR